MNRSKSDLREVIRYICPSQDRLFFFDSVSAEALWLFLFESDVPECVKTHPGKSSS